MTFTPILVRPRDPLSLGNGTDGGHAALSRMTMPSTFAGAIRAMGMRAEGLDFPLVGDSPHAPAERARLARSLQDSVSVRGPYFVDCDQTDPLERVCVLAPADAVYDGVEFLRGRPRRASGTDGVLWARGDTAPAGWGGWIDLPDRIGKTKTSAAARHQPVWTLRQMVRWLAAPEPSEPEHFRQSPDARHTLNRGMAEKSDARRTGVAIDGATQTAADGQLFVHPGLGMAPGFALGAEVRGANNLEHGYIVLGGDGRISHTAEDPGGSFPPFPRAEFESLLAEWGDRRVDGLRWLLVTPAWFPETGASKQGWRPQWGAPGSPHGPTPLNDLRVVGAHIDRPIAISGWDYLRNAPRRVRRLVPAGSQYLLELPGLSGRLASAVRNQLLDAAAALWWRPIVQTPAFPDDNLAAAHADGFGFAIPGFFAWSDTQ